MEIKITPAWLAGFFDGEGHISARLANARPPKHGGEMSFEMGISQKNPWILAAIKEEFPEATLVFDPTRIGFTKRAEMWQLRFSGRRALRVLNYIRPFVLVKKVQVECAIEMCEQMMEHACGAKKKLSAEQRAKRMELGKVIQICNQKIERVS